jgi:acyl carrier protein
MPTVEMVKQTIADYLKLGVYKLDVDSKLGSLDPGPLIDKLEEEFGKKVKDRREITEQTTIKDILDIFVE